MKYIDKHKTTIALKSLATIILASGLFFTGVLLLWSATLKMPDLASFEERKVSQSTKIYDRTGEVLLYDVHQDIRRTVVPLEEISPNLINASIAIEDSAFYKHGGIRVDAIIRAVFKNLASGGFSQGGSTITQQVVKNSVLTQDKKISRKIKEWILALKIEREFTKDEILELYLNETPYGGNVYGVEEASRTFFGKSAKEISIAEAAYMAALPQAPTRYSPYGSNVDKLESRKNRVLLEMKNHGFITEAEYDDALKEKVEFKPRPKFGIIAPHFVFFVREYLAEKYGEEAVEEGGLNVITTLNVDWQEKAEEIVKRHALENTTTFNAENAGLVAVDPKTGQILTMVGSRDYFDEEIPGAFNITTTHRQPGSAFKPIVYAAAFEKGYTPETVVFDLKTQFSTACAPTNLSSDGVCYSPGNYDDAFRGPMTLRNALAQSVNIPAVKVLYLTGINTSLRKAVDMGIKTLQGKDQYGLTLVLGGGEVSLLDLTSAYSVFANKGERNPYVPVLRVETADGEVLEEFDKFENTPERVLTKQASLQISDILSDNVARAPAFGPSSYLNFPGVDVAAKTGTTNDYRDAWIIGYTPEVSVGAWAGNNDNTPMEKKVAGFIIAPLWNEFMQEVLKDVPHTSFEKPQPEDVSKPILKGIWQGGQVFKVNTISGDLATTNTPEELIEQRVVQSVHSILYWVDKDDPRGDYPSNPSSDPQFVLWETPVRIWAGGQGLQDQDPSVIPEETDNDIHSPENAPRISIEVSPKTADEDDSVEIKINQRSGLEIQRVDYFINNQLIGSSINSPTFSISFKPSEIASIQDRNTIRAIAYDEVLNRGEDSTSFRIRD